MYKIGIECESIEDQSWGVGRIVKKLLEEISKRPELACEFRFFLYFKSRIPDLPFLDNPIFVKKIVKLPFMPSSFSLYYYLFLPVKLYSEKLDLMFFPNYMLPVIFRGKSLVVLTEDVYYEFTAGRLPWRYRLAYKIFASWAAKHAAKIMAISESSKKEIAGLFKIAPWRIVVNQLGVDLHSGLETIAAAPKWATGDYILYVGQAFPRRHLKETMLAFAKIIPRFEKLKFVAIGKDKYNPPIISKLKNDINNRLGREAIIYKDYVSENELATLYENAKLLIYVSSKEAFGLPPLEALAYGTPAVVATGNITKEIFEENAFFVANPDNSDSIKAAMIQGLTDDAKRQMILENKNRILSKYTWQKHTDRFLDLCRNF